MHETGVVRKDPGGRLNIALVYPNNYYVGMSNLGIHAMYSAFNRHQGIVCERFFFDHNRSIESGRQLQDFHIIAFSVSYELDWINVVKILKGSGIELKSTERHGRPFVIAGGAAVTLNPEPASDMLDICFLGDGENAPDALYAAFTGSSSFEGCLDMLRGKAGIYIPSEAISKNNKILCSVTDPIAEPAQTSIITSDTAFGDMYLVETARGCPFRCRFCAARKIYTPFRPVPVESLISAFETAKNAGLKLGLVSASLNNHPHADKMYEVIEGLGIRIAPPSLRIGMISPGLLKLIGSSGVKGVTLAPETGSYRLRKESGKDIANEEILNEIENLVAAGIMDIKLYFIIGLPGETLEDVDSIADLVKRARQGFIKVSKGNQKIGNIQVNINTFVPKPHTDFERTEMIDIREAKTRIKRIEAGLKRQSNIRLSYEGPKWAYLQAVIARGDRHVLDLIEKLAGLPESGWQGALKTWERNPDYYALRKRDDDEFLPWDFY